MHGNDVYKALTKPVWPGWPGTAWLIMCWLQFTQSKFQEVNGKARMGMH